MRTTTVYVVEETGGVFVFRRKRKAEKFLISEAWGGSEHLGIAKAQAPAHLSGQELADWATSNVPSNPRFCEGEV